jgi:hypothetical protein
VEKWTETGRAREDAHDNRLRKKILWNWKGGAKVTPAVEQKHSRRGII